jgi:hypothetical protein
MRFQSLRLEGCDETAWQWLQKLRRAIVRPGHDQVAGSIQLDETYVGGRKTRGKRRHGAASNTLVAIAGEDKSLKGIGRIRLQVLPHLVASRVKR